MKFTWSGETKCFNTELNLDWEPCSTGEFNPTFIFYLDIVRGLRGIT